MGVTSLAGVVSWLAAILALIAFAIDIVLYERVKHQANDLTDARPKTS